MFLPISCYLRSENGLAGALDELQEISHGIQPAILSQGGLAHALTTLARRSALPSSWMSAPRRGCPSRWRSPPTMSCRRRSRTQPSTPTPPSCVSPSTSATVSSSFPSVTAAPAVRIPPAVPDSSGSPTAWTHSGDHRGDEPGRAGATVRLRLPLEAN